MSYLSHLSGLACIALLAVNLACGSKSSEGQSSSELIAGSETFDRPEIGRLHLSNNSLCTATLIAPQVVITAAHCVDYRTSDVEQVGHFGYFLIDRIDHRPAWYEIDAIRSFGSRTGADDFAVLRLGEAVLAEHATPAEISYGPTGNGSQITIFGYGCTERARRSGSGTKRAFETRYDESFNLCPGDSGGPVVLGRDGPVVLINSAYYTRSGKDIFARPYRWRDEIEAQVQAWTPVLKVEPDPPTCIGGASDIEAEASIFPLEGKICSGRDSWFSIELEQDDQLNLEIHFDHDEGDIDVSFHDEHGGRISISQGTSDSETIRYSAHQTNSFLIRIYGYSGAENTVSVRAEIVRN